MNKINYLENSLHTPDIYHRRYDLDLPTKDSDSGWLELGKRTALTALPFVSLIPPAGAFLSLGMGSVRAVSHVWGAYQADNWTTCSTELLHTAFAVLSVASTFYNFTIGLAASTLFEVLEGAYNIYAYSDDPYKMVEELLQTVASAVYLGFMATGMLEVLLVFTLMQAVVSFYQAYGEISQERYLEAAGKIAFGFVRLAQAKGIVEEIQRRNAVSSVTVNFSGLSGELKKEFMESIANAKKSIVCMTFGITDKELIDLLLQKQQQGVAVTLVVDKDHTGDLLPHVGKLRLFKRTDGEGRYHHKITVIDESTVWIGSANLSPDALTKQSNTMLRLESPQMAKALHEEMEVFEKHRKRSSKPHPLFNVGGQDVELLLFPHVPFDATNPPEKTLNEHGRKRVLDLINQSQNSLKIAICMWTDPDIALAVTNAKKRGVDVEVVLFRAMDSPDVHTKLANAGVSVKETPHLHFMHNKWMLVDDNTFFNGSANWSRSWFTRNDESGVILHNLTSAQKDAINSYWRELSK